MTEIKTNKAVQVPDIKSIFVWTALLAMMIYFFRAPELASASVKNALGICATGLIPSLFPFIVIVGIMNRSGFSQFISRLAGRPIGRLWGIPKEAAYALFLGIIGGFPIGAVCLAELYKSEAISKNDAENMLGTVNNASPAFCVGVLGINTLGSARLGWVLYVSQLAASLIISNVSRKKQAVPYAEPQKILHRPISQILSEAVAEGGITMLKICSFAVFFSVIGDAVCLAAKNACGIYAAACCAALTELTLAGRMASELSGTAALAVCAFAVGWSGISVHMQTASVISESRLSLKSYVKKKLLQGLISAASAVLIYFFVGS